MSHDRYASMPYRRCGRSGLQLPAISLGLWHNFGEDRPLALGRKLLRTAFDAGITHFDLANNYGPPPGAAEERFGCDERRLSARASAQVEPAFMILNRSHPREGERGELRALILHPGNSLGQRKFVDRPNGVTSGKFPSDR